MAGVGIRLEEISYSSPIFNLLSQEIIITSTIGNWFKECIDAEFAKKIYMLLLLMLCHIYLSTLAQNFHY